MQFGLENLCEPFPKYVCEKYKLRRDIERDWTNFYYIEINSLEELENLQRYLNVSLTLKQDVGCEALMVLECYKQYTLKEDEIPF